MKRRLDGDRREAPVKSARARRSAAEPIARRGRAVAFLFLRADSAGSALPESPRAPAEAFLAQVWLFCHSAPGSLEARRARGPRMDSRLVFPQNRMLNAASS
jgi:hypothetical protein